MKKYKVKKGQPYPLGAYVLNGGVNFSVVNSSDEDCSVILYKKGVEQKVRIDIDRSNRIGNISCIFVEDLQPGEYEYNFRIGDKVFVDPYAKRIMGNEKWRGAEFKQPFLRGGFYSREFDWQGAQQPHIPYNESIMYCLHVRGFTKHRSSGVKHRGTFEGIIEKIPYLKELGVNSLELMPAYEFEECEWASGAELALSQTIEYQVQHIDEELSMDKEPQRARRLNYWGFKEAYYFAPKASYSSDANPCVEFKKMVRELHKNGIEVIMQFYFPDNIKPGYILDIIKHWVIEYQIDGVHLKGGKVPVTLIATEPILANAKIMCEHFSLDEIYAGAEIPAYKNLGYYRDEFMYDMRKYLKGDSDMLKSFQYHMRNISASCGVVNYITNYYGFTLNDLVSYDRKHNEENGENNSDGNDYNYSWNCGVEGPSRKKAINQLRKRQMKNALCFLFTAQGTPLIMSGDEFGNSKNGNNNSYCQDNETGWVDWRGLSKNADIYEFAKLLIKFRQAHGILHLDTSLSMLDRYGCGYPDLSYHGEEAWKAQLDSYNRHIGIMYCGTDSEGKEGDYIYIAYNMHWETHRFALPSLADYEWVHVFDTNETPIAVESDKGSSYADIPPRSIAVLAGRKLPKTQPKPRAKTCAIGKKNKKSDSK